MQATVIRPPLVYGPGVRANFLRLMASVQRGVPLPLGSVSNRRSMVSVWNLCDLIRGALDSSSPLPAVMLVSDGMDLSTPDLIRRLAAAMGRPARLVRAPVSLLRVVGRLTNRNAEIDRLLGSLQVDIVDTCKALDWAPPLSVDEGLSRTVRWYREAHG
jgi:nucleoside-diphosphate-sugar epimerase